MQHQKYDLGRREKGATVVVTLKNQANVQIMDERNYRIYSSGRGGRYEYIGGLVKKSPYRAVLPKSGHWYVAIDLGGYAGKVQSSVRVEPAPSGFLPPARDMEELRQVLQQEPQQPPSGVMEGRTWDVFVSHAHEDKDSVARPLSVALERHGVNCWLDEFELRIGDSLRRRIDQGIASSRFGVVVLSPAFIAKGWTQYELDGLVTRTVAGEQNLLPIWHAISKEELIAYSPSLADKVALSTGQYSIGEIADKIADVVTEAHA